MHPYSDSLSLEQQIGQLLMVGFSGTTPSPEVIDLIENYHVGNIVLFSRNIKDIHQLHTLTTHLQEIARKAGQRYPLLIAIDQENGMVQRLGPDATPFPGNMALGAIGSEQIVYEVAQATGRELRALGIGMNLAPVVDVNNNPANPVIGSRSFGEDPQQVARLGVAIVRGLHDAGIIACLKHFPGHGDTTRDSHLALPTLPYTLERLAALELLPFEQGIAAGVDCIMSAHIAFPALTNGIILPATLSPEIIRGLLRQRLGFEGVIISDCLEMKAISETVGVAPASIMALQAGIDLVLISHRFDRHLASLKAIHEAALNGVLPPDILHTALTRVLRLKERYLSWEQIDTPLQENRKEHMDLSRRAYRLSTTLVRNEEGLIPLHVGPDQQIAVLYPLKKDWTKVADKNHPLSLLTSYIRQRHTNVYDIPFTPLLLLEEQSAIQQAISEAALIIMATVNANLDAQQAALMHSLLASGKPVVGIAVHNPYDLAAFPDLSTYLVTYEYTAPALAAAVSVLFGEQKAQGHLPVSLIPGEKH
jgi:beta-N-acetylhexosaminidase